MTRTFKTEAIVLKKRSMLNHDSLVTLFSKENGKLTVFAKGIRKLTSRRLPHNQTGNLVKAVIYKRHDHYYLQETQLISLFSQIKKSNEKINKLYLYLFILDRLLPENQQESEIYDATKKYFIELSAIDDNIYECMIKHVNYLLKYLGYITHDLTLMEIRLKIEEIVGQKIPYL